MELFNLFFGASRGWVEAALLVCLFWTALARPERIRSLTEFRIAGVLLALAIVAPSLIQLCLILAGDGGLRGPPRMGQDFAAVVYLMAIPPVLLALSVILGLDSVIRKTRGTVAAPDASWSSDTP
jgi:hypothetical protein